MKLSNGVAAAVLLASAKLYAQLEDTDAATRAKCEEYLKVPLPEEAAQVNARAKWPGCDSYKEYSGIGTAVDYAGSRACAWQERPAKLADLGPRYTKASVLGGAAMLAVLYANGEGVKRDFQLALRFACEAGGAPAEIRIRIEHLESMRAKPSDPSSKFEFCDDITSGFMEGFCASYGSEMADQKRYEKIRQLKAGMTEGQRQSFNVLVKAQEAYSRAHAKGEIDLSGTARAMLQIDAEQTLAEDFLEALKSYESSSRFPSGTTNEYRDADSQLNSVYRQAIADAEAHRAEYGAIQPEGVRSAERAWLKYRDAWIAFAGLRYPRVTAESWLTLLTKDRTSILDGSFCDMDAVEGKCGQGGDTWKPSPLP